MKTPPLAKPSSDLAASHKETARPSSPCPPGGGAATGGGGRQISPPRITSLASNEVFVFGANLAGIHGAGAAWMAERYFEAAPGVGSGHTGKCYAIPTKDRNIRTLPLPAIQERVNVFIGYAQERTDLTFLVTEIGCGLAGYEPEQIAPMFAAAGSNVRLPKRFVTVLEGCK